MLVSPPLDSTKAAPVSPAALGIGTEMDAFLKARRALLDARNTALSKWVNAWFERAWAGAISARLRVMPHIHEKTPWVKPESASFADEDGWHWHPTVWATWSAEAPYAVTFTTSGMRPDGVPHHGNSRGPLSSPLWRPVTEEVVTRFSLRWQHDACSLYVSALIAPPPR